jgi:PEP-CTERM motif
MTHHFSSYSCRHLVAAALALGTLGTAQAASTWSADFSGCQNGSVLANAGAWSSSLNTTCPLETGGVDVKVGAVSWSSDVPAGAQVVSWGGSGLGILSAGESSSTTGAHAIDNYGVYDSLVLKFSESVSIDQLSVGWDGNDNPSSVYNDADVAVFAWVGATPGASVTPTGLSPLDGWRMVAAIENIGSYGGAVDTANFSSGGYTSSYWMVAAYGTDCNYDAFKLLKVAGSTGTTPPPPSGVPEPGSLALMALVAGGLTWRRKGHKGTSASRG